jgi:hypothetical protein
MKLASHNNKLETNIQDAETQNFGIGDASVVIEILRNRLYEHKIQTLVQEYICNARDAMRECGKANEFEVTCPTSLSPVFKVRDFGPGISPDRMANVFIKYGASTKRDSNNQTGGFGIGAKSAWSYTDSFTIVTYIDGNKRTYVAHTGVNNNGRLDLLSTAATSEPNGTEIQVPVGRYDLDEFRRAIYRAVYFWESRPTLKGGNHELPTLVGGERISDLVEVIDYKMLPAFLNVDYYDNMLAVIDGVPYMITSKLMDKVKKLKDLKQLTKRFIVLHFGNGLVEVSASRESIADSKATVEGLEKLAAQGVVAIKTKISSDFSKVKSSSDFFKTYLAMEPYFHVDKLAKYDVYQIDGGYVKADLLHKVSLTRMHMWGRNSRVQVDRITKEQFDQRQKQNGIRLQYLNNVYFLRASENAIIQNKRLRENIGPNLPEVLLIEQLGDNSAEFEKLILDLNAKDFQTLTYVEKPRAPRVKIERDKQEFCIHQFLGVRHHYTSLADNTDKWLYIPMSGGSLTNFSNVDLKDVAYFVKETTGLIVCGLSENVVEKVKDNANFLPFSEWIAKFKPTDKQMAYVKMMEGKNTSVMSILSKLKGLKDKFILEMIEEYKGAVRNDFSGDPVPKMFLELIKNSEEYKEFVNKDGKLKDLIGSKYRLLSMLDDYYFSKSTKYAEEIVIYMNAKHKAKA